MDLSCLSCDVTFHEGIAIPLVNYHRRRFIKAILKGRIYLWKCRSLKNICISAVLRYGMATTCLPNELIELVRKRRTRLFRKHESDVITYSVIPRRVIC